MTNYIIPIITLSILVIVIYKLMVKKDNTTSEREVDETTKENTTSRRVINDHMAHIMNIKKKK